MNTAHQLQIKRQLPQSAEQIYAAFTQGPLLARWLAPGPMTVAEAQAEARVGGRYRVVMQGNEGAGPVVGGEYLELQPHHLLRMSWAWEGSPVRSEVRVELQTLEAGGCELTLTHGGFESAEACEKHHQGWSGCLPKLDTL